MSFLIRIVFAVAACAIMVVAAVLLVYAPYSAIEESLSGGRPVSHTLFSAVGYLIVAIALFDVAKYFFEEEVPAQRERRTAADARRGLTKFISTIIIAVFLEALVLVFETSRENVSDIVYPALLMGAGCVTLISLGLFQRLSASVEKDIGPEPESGTEPPLMDSNEPGPLASGPANR
ncbi:GNAT family acetyltransferase [Ancylobacter pratisalsi]|uniref:GNAT family acetyltransferase n=1 Tax=Ancylobacter pratisalsi TaxID=1745854 RepID=A0A6P1YQV4_9HYPH|nr:GNAT family acetyltransferase [Ancylobacter pratisalsi]QIB35867.1 GNAT family acetyltransferase [Ancylobacter pratisalsi]